MPRYQTQIAPDNTHEGGPHDVQPQPRQSSPCWRRATRKQSLIAGVCLIALWTWAAHGAAQEPTSAAPQLTVPAADDDEMIEGEVLTRGPIHEAFATAVEFDPQPGVVAPKAPPPDVEELPPEEKPEGDDFIWIPGYWWWDEELDDYIWISGVWRRVPPGHVWIDGYWEEVGEGFQRVPGYWTPIEDESEPAEVEVEYLPEPPESLETGPSSPQPSEEHFWVCGSWRWYNQRYVWRPGYWTPGVQGWVWVPTRYVWTPAGYVCIPGYWDYALVHRGLTFCPVYFGRAVYTRPPVHYTPRIAIHVGRLHTHLFYRPGYSHYYFGDYYSPHYVQLGFAPWFSLDHSRRAYDPLYTYHHWYFSRRDRSWSSRVQSWYDWHVRHESARPPRTFAAMEKRAGSRHDLSRSTALADRVDRLFADRGHGDSGVPIRLERIASARRQEYKELGTRMREIGRGRMDLERQSRNEHDGRGISRGAHRESVATGDLQRMVRQLTERRPDAPSKEGRGAERFSRQSVPPPAKPDFRGRLDERASGVMDNLRDRVPGSGRSLPGVGRESSGPPSSNGKRPELRSRSEREAPQIRSLPGGGRESSGPPSSSSNRPGLRSRLKREAPQIRSLPGVGRESSGPPSSNSDRPGLRSRSEREMPQIRSLPGVGRGSSGRPSASSNRPSLRSGSAREAPGPRSLPGVGRGSSGSASSNNVRSLLRAGPRIERSQPRSARGGGRENPRTGGSNRGSGRGNRGR